MLSTARRVAFTVVVALLALYPTLLFGLRLAAGLVAGDSTGTHGGRPAAALGAFVFLGLSACLIRLARGRATIADAHAMTGYALAALIAQLVPGYADGAGSICLFAAVALVLFPVRRQLLAVRPRLWTLLASTAGAIPIAAVGITRAQHVRGLTGDSAENYYDAAWMMLTIAMLLLAAALGGRGSMLVGAVATGGLTILGIDSLIAPHPLFLGRPLGIYSILAAATVAALHWRGAERGTTAAGVAEADLLTQAPSSVYTA